METALAEIAVGIPVDRVAVADGVLLEAELMEWSVQEDAVGRTARLVGVFADEMAARSAWEEL